MNNRMTGRKITLICIMFMWVLIIATLILLSWKQEAQIRMAAIQVISSVASTLTGGFVGSVLGYYFGKLKKEINK